MLRDYQIKAIDGLRDGYRRGVRRLLLHLATGGGKTRCFSEVLKGAHAKGTMALVVVRGRKLIKQASDRLRRDGVPHGIIMAGAENATFERIRVCSIDTLYSRRHAPEAALIVIDEAHQTTGEGYKWFLEQYPRALILAVTATPHLKRGMRHVADEVIRPITARELTEQGYLVPLRYWTPEKPDLSEVTTSGDDFNQRELGVAMRKAALSGNVVKTYLEMGGSRRAILFAVDIEHSRQLVGQLGQAGVAADHIDANCTDEQRDKAVKRLETGEIKVLSNVGVLTTGVDVPAVELVIMARPTKSYNLWIQMCLDDRTEVLTAAGFKMIGHIHDGEPVASFDMGDGAIEWVPADGVFTRPIGTDEAMYQYQSPHIDIRVTAGHDVVIRAGRDHYAGPWSKMPVEVIAERKSEFSVPTAGQQRAEGIDLSDDELFFIGFWLADGTIDKKTGALSITQSSHQPWFNQLRPLFERLGFPFREYMVPTSTSFAETSPRVRFHFRRGRLGRERDPRGISRLDPYLDKNFSPLLDGLTADQLGVLLYGLHLGDGSKQKATWTQRSYHIACGRMLFADRLQSLCVRRGFQCNVARQANLWMLHIKRQTQRHLGGATYRDRPTFRLSPVQPDEMVWCLTTKHGTLVTRRNGKVVILGNCGRGTRPCPDVEKTDCYVFDHAGNVERHGLLEQERECDLDGKKHKDPPQIKQCGQCFSWAGRFESVCPVCAAPFNDKPKGGPRKKDADEEAQLRAYSLPPWEEELERLVGMGKRGGYKPGFVYHRMKSMYGAATAKAAWKRLKEREPSWVKTKALSTPP